MKKFAAIFAVVVLIAFAAPVFAAINPFMDVPINSWAYDAVASLASKGILSGYPDGLYKGRQSMTRYEAASAIARALAYVDMTKASKQDVDMLKRLIVEFKDELDALGVRVDAIEKDMNLFKKRLNGWRISGRLRFDVDFRAVTEDYQTVLGLDGKSKGNMGNADARINIDRFFGEEEKAFFRIQIRNRMNSNHSATIDDAAWDNGREFMPAYFYATIPFMYDSFLTVGWVGDDDMDRRFGFAPDIAGRYNNFGWFNDTRMFMMKLEKSFELGNFYGYLAHQAPGVQSGGSDAWIVFANFDFKWNEQLGLGIGGQYIKEDEWNAPTDWSSVFTGWVGVDFNFIPGAAFHGAIYFQSKDGNASPYDESANAWRLAFDLGQDLLNFTSLYAEYGRVGQYFYSFNSSAHNMFVVGDKDALNVPFLNQKIALDDITYWKVGAIQKWTEKVRTWLFYVNATTTDAGFDAGVRQYGIGLDYVYNPYTIFSLNYMRWQGFDNYDDRDYSRIRFTTQISF
jgi:hypothetical protein